MTKKVYKLKSYKEISASDKMEFAILYYHCLRTIMRLEKKLQQMVARFKAEEENEKN